MDNKILCPTLRIGVNYQMLKPDDEGWVYEKDLRNFLKIIGVEVDTILGSVLIGTAKAAVKEKREGYINIYKLGNTFLDHGSSSCIYHKGFSEERLNDLKSFMVNGRLTSKEIAKVCTHYHENPIKRSSNLGTNVYSFEMENFLHVYGREDENGVKYFTEQDVDDLWKHNKFPEGFKVKYCPVVGTKKSIKNWITNVLLRLKL